MKSTVMTKALWRLQSFNSTSDKSGLFHFAVILASEFIESEEVEQIGTDGTRVVYNPKWWAKQPIDNQVFALAHEATHISSMHCERSLEVNDPERWNKACDIWVNHYLLKIGHKPSREIYIDGSMFGIRNPERYTVDQIYKLLPPTPPQEKGGAGKGGMSAGDDMLKPDSSNNAQEIKAVKMERIRQVAQGVGYDISKLPEFAEEAYQNSIAPQRNWVEECYKFVARLRESHWSTRKLMPAYRARRVIMPAIKRSNKLEFAFIADTSGSIEGPTYSMFVETIKDAFEQLKPERMIGVLADDMVRHVVEFDKMPDKIPFRGRGGTDFRPAIKYIEDNHPEIGGVIYLTDGYGDFPKKAPSFPLLWAIDNNNVKPPFGEICLI